jgi:four helix bundle protein
MPENIAYFEDTLKQRTKAFAVRVFKLCRKLERDEQGRIVGRQLMRAASSVAANYRAACRCRSHADFVAKIGVVLEEADESAFWLEFLPEIGLLRPELLDNLRDEANQLVAIFAKSQHTARKKSHAAAAAAAK